MTASYRIVHFSPDPITGARFPLGAVVLDEGGEVRVARVEHVPGAACLGSQNLAVAAQRLVARLDAVRSMDALPAVFGPYVHLSETRHVPHGVTDALAWVSGLFSAPQPRKDDRGAPRRHQRATIGYRFFTTWHVDRFVRHTFRPEADGGDWLSRHAVGLPQISHWVSGRHTVLLMEPLVPTRPRFADDLKEIAQRCLAYRFALEHAPQERSGQLVAYLTAGGDPSRRAGAFEALRGLAHRVVDTDSADQRSALVEAIREIGASGDAQQAIAQA